MHVPILSLAVALTIASQSVPQLNHLDDSKCGSAAVAAPGWGGRPARRIKHCGQSAPLTAPRLQRSDVPIEERVPALSRFIAEKVAAFLLWHDLRSAANDKADVQFLRLTYEPDPITWRDATFRPGRELVTFYLADYAVNLPLDLVVNARVHVHSPMMVVNLQGFSKFTLSTSVLQGSSYFRHFQFPAPRPEAARIIEATEPGYLRWFNRVLRERFDFICECDLYDALYTEDFGQLQVWQPAPHVFSDWVLAHLKLLLTPAVDPIVRRVRVPEGPAVAFGRLRDPDAPLQITNSLMINLCIGGDVISLWFYGLDRLYPDVVPMRQAIPAITTSVRRHNSTTPGWDMLAEAFNVLRHGDTPEHHAIARGLVLSAAGYRDVLPQAIAFGELLIDPTWDDNARETYLERLYRLRDDPYSWLDRPF